MGGFYNGHEIDKKRSNRMNTGALPQFLEVRWKAIACKSDDELDQKVLSRSDSDGKDCLRHR